MSRSALMDYAWASPKPLIRPRPFKILNPALVVILLRCFDGNAGDVRHNIESVYTYIRLIMFASSITTSRRRISGVLFVVRLGTLSAGQETASSSCDAVYCHASSMRTTPRIASCVPAQFDEFVSLINDFPARCVPPFVAFSFYCCVCRERFLRCW